MVLSHLSAAHSSHAQAPESEVVYMSRRETQTVPELLSETVPAPEAATEQQARSPMRHWTKQEEIKHRGATGIPPPSPANPLEAFQRQLEIMNAQTKRRQEQIAKGYTNNGTFPLNLPDEVIERQGEGDGWQLKDDYTGSYKDTVQDSKKQKTAKSLNRLIGGL